MSGTSVAVSAAFGSLGLLWLYRRLMLHRGISKLQNKVVLITGASSGVGEGIRDRSQTLFRGWPVIFMAKKKGAWNFLRSERGEAKKFWDNFYLHQAPLTSVCEQSLRNKESIVLMIERPVASINAIYWRKAYLS